MSNNGNDIGGHGGVYKKDVKRPAPYHPIVFNDKAVPICPTCPPSSSQ